MLLGWLLSDFKQVKKINKHFSDFEQVKKISSYFAGFKQVKNLVVILLLMTAL